MPVRVEDDGEAIASGGNKLMIGEGQRAEARKTVPSAATFGSLGRPVNTGSSQPATRIDSNSRPTMAFTLGIDFGTNSARALVVRCRDGAELGSCVARYRSGRQGVLLDPGDAHLARQHPGDYPVALEECVRGALAAAGRTRGFSAARVVGVGVDTTGSSPIPVDRRNRPLALGRKWRRNLEAQCWLWKDHTSWREAARITQAATRPPGSPRPRRGCGPRTSRNAGTGIPRSGSGRRYGTAWRWPRASSTRRTPGWSWLTGFRPSWPGSPTPSGSSAGSAPRATRRSTATGGEASRTRVSSPRSIPGSPACGTASTGARSTPRPPPAP